MRQREGLEAEGLGEFKRRGGVHAEIARQNEQRLLELILGHEQRLLVIGKLHLGTEHVDAGRGTGIVLVLGQFEQRGGVIDPGLRGIGTGHADCALR